MLYQLSHVRMTRSSATVRLDLNRSARGQSNCSGSARALAVGLGALLVDPHLLLTQPSIDP